MINSSERTMGLPVRNIKRPKLAAGTRENRVCIYVRDPVRDPVGHHERELKMTTAVSIAKVWTKA